MKLRYLLDTNVLSEPVRPAPDPGILEHLRRHQGEVATATVVWHELLFGCERLPPSRKREAIERYLVKAILEGLPVLPYDIAAAQWHAEERARLMGIGRSLPFADGQIAAIARVNGLTLVSANRADFESCEGLAIEDWRSRA